MFSLFNYPPQRQFGVHLCRKLSQQAHRMETAIKVYILSQLKTGQVTMWTSESSPRLEETEKLLETEKVPYDAIDVDKEFPGERQKIIKDALFEYTHSHAFPSVFVSGEYIGNLQDLESAIKSGSLKRSLKLQ
ncbi:hypothetical protein FGO68_gene1445 [Halteria grandinella]|uniref:Glutaredoxin domain-containing protein n=1 Tax=Halteria grandinella TaxID=5974 RepID=A0A8J8NIG4_HALGN|nr:hypothetical protein FGO68_gene1445 [Halteria grandinella]